MQNKKIKIALICDIRGWAFSNIAKEIKKNLNTVFDIDIFYSNEDYENIYDLYKDTILKDYDLIHFFWRLQLFNIFNPDILKFCPIPLSKLIENFVKKTITSSVYDHAFITEHEIKYYENIFSLLADNYTVSSKKLFEIYKHIDHYKLPKKIIRDGVDLNIFYPKKIKRFKNKKKYDLIKIGWVGNSKWSLKKGMDNKGIKTIIEPAIIELKKQGYKVISNFADRNKGFIPLHKMVDYYSNIDVLICASDIEGTPNPVLEAMACGVPIISTNVGIVTEIIGKNQSKFIYDRTPKALAKKIKKLIENPQFFDILSKENQQEIKNHTRKKESKEWSNFFIESINFNKNKDILKKSTKIGEYVYEQSKNKLQEFINKIRIKIILLKKIKIGLFIEKIK